MATNYAALRNPDQSRASLDRLSASLTSIVSELETEAEDRVARRSLTEQRWLRDLRQQNSEYEPDDLKKMLDAEKSSLFINQTRPKTNACEARLSDMLFPTEDDNWAIKPTPVPELVQAAKEAVEKAKDAVFRANEAKDGGDPEEGRRIAEEGQAFAVKSKELKDELEEARKRSRAMADEIRDQLKESSYPMICRDLIRDACQIGTGVMLGPVGATERSRRSWKTTTGDIGPDIYQLDMVEDARPAYRYVDPWGFFPQSDALTVDDSESFFERYLNTKKAMRKLAREPDFNKEAIRRILMDGPAKSLPVYLSQLRAIKGDNIQPNDERYVVWCYRGPLAAEQMQTICACMGDDQLAQASGIVGEVDPLQEMNVVLWFCQGEVLKFGVHHLDSGEGLYSVFNIEKDNASIWGYGIPYIMRNSQKAMNGAWRMMMDNSGLSSGPQIEIDLDVVEPADGIISFVARKVWKRKTQVGANRPGIRTYEIESHQAELAAIIELSKQFIDDETNMSVIAQGEQGAHTTQTSSGMAMLMNSVNVVFRRMVKAFDDDITVPNIRRLYDWNIQFAGLDENGVQTGSKDHIKGDFDVDARGSSVLLVKEVQAQNLILALNYTNHPVLGQMLKGAPLLRKTFQSMLIEADEVVLTDDELAEKMEQQKRKPDPEMAKLKLQDTISQRDAETRLAVAEIERDTKMLTLAETLNLKQEDIRALFSQTQLKLESTERIKSGETASKERLFAGEAALEEKKDLRGDTSGSGGSLS